MKLQHRSLTAGQDKAVWRCQFHTYFINKEVTVFKNRELDEAITVGD